MKKILCMIDTLAAGGAQRQLVELACGFKKRGYDVRFLVYYKAFSDYYNSTLSAAGIEIDDVDESNYLLRILKMRRKIYAYSPDAVIAFLEVPAFIAEMSGLLPRRWRLIAGERSASPKKLAQRRLRFFLHCHRFADAVVANSEANLKIVRQVAPELDKKKLHVIYNSMNPEKLTPDEGFVFCSGEKRNILVASSHQYLKNLDGLIEAVHRLTEDERKQLVINWYGHNKFSSYDHSLEEGQQKIKDYGLEDVFRFHDATLDIYQKMNEADAVALFSKFEGFPNAICEGMYLGKPVIATCVSDIPLLLKDGENAFLADPESADSIAAALRRFIAAAPQQLQTMGAANAAKARNLFDREKILDQYEQLF